jgi:AraC-like DNA-binding protein
MWYDVSRVDNPQSSASLSLQTLYEVRADGSYDILPAWPLKSPFVAIRTLSGNGILDAERSESFHLTPGTLLIMPWSKIKRFRCPGKAWHFWWFEFHPIASLPLPFQRLLQLEIPHHEITNLKACFSDLRQNGPRFQARASARLVLLMHDWAAEWSGDPTPQTRHQAAIQRVVQLMHSHLTTRLSLPEMARAAGLSERRFRQVFARLTGKSPKRFHEELRLRKAADHLRFHAGNVSEIADEFGYSSPFHFSKSFRNFFGVPPLRYLCKRSETI